MSDSILGGQEASLEEVADVFNGLDDSTKGLILGKLGDAVKEDETLGLKLEKTEGAVVAFGRTTADEVVAVLMTESGNAVSVKVQSGTLVMNFDVPAGSNVVLKGPDVPQTPAEAFAYLSNVLGSVDQGFKSGLEVLKGILGSSPQKVAVNVITNSPGQGGSSFSGDASALKVTGTGATKDLFVLEGGGSFELVNVKSAFVVGDATVMIDNLKGSAVSGDGANQVLIGGTGEDTLISGGGTDVMTGGEGVDTFASNGFGTITITDFTIGSTGPSYTGDFFDFAYGVDADVVFSFLTDVKAIEGGTAVEFGEFLTINFVGVDLDTLLATYQDWVLVDGNLAF